MSRAGRGRPLRFVGAVGMGWIVMRLGMLWPAGADPPPIARPVPLPHATASGTIVALSIAHSMVHTPSAPPPVAAPQSRPEPIAAARPLRRPASSVAADPLGDQTEGAGMATIHRAEAMSPAALPKTAPDAARRRWVASAWLALRPGQGIGAAPAAGQLGGSQYGLRLERSLDARGKMAAFGRVAGPLRGAGAEVALGLEWRPFAAPLRFAIEQRFGLDGIRGGPGIGAVTGLDKGTAGFRLEAYGQAGMILRDRAEPYADGALRLTRAAVVGRPAAPALGIGVWGAAQRDTQRLDLGPTAVVRLPIGGLQTRIALDWRQRVAGSARPGSGVALTLGSDF